MAEVVPLTPSDLSWVADHLRPADRAELLASGHGFPREAIADAYSRSTDMFALKHEGEPLCVFGIAPQVTLLTPLGSPWMLGTAGLRRHAGCLIRETRRYLADVETRYPILINFVDARNSVSIRYLAASGFTLEDAAPYGPEGLPFHRFHKGLV